MKCSFCDPCMCAIRGWVGVCPYYRSSALSETTELTPEMKKIIREAQELYQQSIDSDPVRGLR